MHCGRITKPSSGARGSWHLVRSGLKALKSAFNGASAIENGLSALCRNLPPSANDLKTSKMLDCTYMRVYAHL